MWKVILITSVLSIVAFEQSVAQPFWSVGPKIGYTLGDSGGFTWGFEASYFPQQQFPLWGFTFDATFWKNYSSLHFGMEVNEIIGIDVGPTLFYSNQTLNAGLSVIPFAGMFLIGYYELAVPFSQTLFQSWGGYFKVPIGYLVDG